MINGDEDCVLSSKVSSDLVDGLQPSKSEKLDGADASSVSSRYSSCGESDFERYASANSVMGTPSLCSSFGTFHECPDSEFGSLKSFGLGDSCDLDNFALDGNLDSKPEKTLIDKFGFLKDEVWSRKSDSSLGNDVDLERGFMNIKNESASSSCGVYRVFNGDDGFDLPSHSELRCALHQGINGENVLGGISKCWEPRPRRLSDETASGKDIAVEEVLDNKGLNIAAIDGLQLSASSVDQEGFESQLRMEQVHDSLNCSTSEIDRNCDLEYSDECESSTRYEHSESEDSMFGCGAYDERLDVYHSDKAQHLWKSNDKNENSLFMSSSIAYGVEDWADFMQASGENTGAATVLNDVGKHEKNTESEFENLNFTSQIFTRLPSIDEPEQSLKIPMTTVVQGDDKSVKGIKTCSTDTTDFMRFVVHPAEEVKNVLADSSTAKNVKTFGENVEILSFVKHSETTKDPLNEDTPFQVSPDELKSENQFNCVQELNGSIEGDQFMRANNATATSIGLSPGRVEHEGSNLPLRPSSDSAVNLSFLNQGQVAESKIEKFPTGDNAYSLPSFEDSNLNETMEEDALMKTQNLELDDIYNEVVHDMEEILLDSCESPGARYINSNKRSQSQVLLPVRDGGSTASTSGTDNNYSSAQISLQIDRVEVVSASQRRGDVSLGKRLVGVKEYTVYNIRAWSGKNHWKVERRYREFQTLYYELKTLFYHQGLTLPSPWVSVEQETRKVFGNASQDSIAERSLLIQECLQSVIHFRFLSIPSSTLLLFLSPPKGYFGSSTSNLGTPQSLFSTRCIDTDTVSTLGKTISLIVDIWAYKSTKQLLEGQHYTCAGCHNRFDNKKTRIQGFIHTLGWGKPRLCEYSGQLFCPACHANETAVLPARVLHFWDFAYYPVSQFAKSYLDSIYDQPMLCVSAVNPFLFSKVPALQHVRNKRRKICAMIPYVICPFRQSIYKGLGSRRYLLESNDFFALKDLVDLSKGMFAALPVIIDNISRKILDHITEQCLICCDTGVPCNARQACPDPTSLIFPFQEEEIERCSSCESAFHKACIKHIATCSCGTVLNLVSMAGGTTNRSIGVSSEMGGTEAESKSTLGFFSGLLSKVRPGNLQGTRDNDTVILMGSLPVTSI